MFGQVDAGIAAEMTTEILAALEASGRMVIEFAGVESFDFDPIALGATMAYFAQRGLRVAVVAANPVYYGIGRQVALSSGVEGSSVAVFTDAAAALEWLLGREKGVGRGDRI